jgi:hypothetical protein
MKKWLKTLLSESAEASFGRLASSIVLVFGLGWGTYIVIKKLEVPSLQGIATLAASLYGSSKLGETIKAFAGLGKRDSNGSKDSGKVDNPDAKS